MALEENRRRHSEPLRQPKNPKLNKGATRTREPAGYKLQISNIDTCTNRHYLVRQEKN
jgi:hypothetical protein